MKKKLILLTAIITAVVMIIITTCFYITPVGKVVYYKLLSLTDDVTLSKLAKAEYIIDREFMGEIDKNTLTDSALSGYVSALGDPYTGYLSANVYRNMTESMEGSYRGIGIACTIKDKQIVIKEVTEQSPAKNAGLEVGDIILSVNGKKYNGDTFSDALSAIKSTKEGKSVILGIKRGEETLEKEIKISRISRGYVEEKILDGYIGYIRIKTFGTDIAEDFEKAIKSIHDKKAESLIIDLRSNPGGSLESVVVTTDLLLGEGIITTVKAKDGDKEEYKSDKNEVDLPMCVLINSESASASEIMAGALKHYKKATLVGEKTFGKGVVQAIYEFGDGSALKLTVAKYFTPSGECIDGVGISPDIEVLMPDGMPVAEEKILTEEDVQLQRAKEILMKK